ncbi:type I-E CRISPR-associated protein Cas7/Cse4/CasC [Allokutzneria sp. NRRL B-24872]|uniref:type I-E CRISPR-associated protein Cas7/Cse4/CasC n=1 Tax=Allokutzneria sp. NRRL B-24872 TaxID=1137961 RepID=UPI00143D42EA|nr:type I-E CRISPR-associated protein Cas7/Cse4/CasC [Allokutzneria sp. NRRL B-24872]
MSGRILDIHVTQAIPYANLNRDDHGEPKQMIFGGVNRGRVASQCEKRSTRTTLRSHPDYVGDLGTRTKFAAVQLRDDLIGAGWDPEAATRGAADLFHPLRVSKNDADTDSQDEEASAKKKGRAAKKDDSDAPLNLATKALVYLNISDRQRLVELAETHRGLYDGTIVETTDNQRQEGRKKRTADLLKVLNAVTGDGLALFGRMISQLPEGTLDGAVQVAHSFTTHEAISQPDYFTAVEELPGLASKVSAGAAHLDQASYLSGTFYRYATLDLDELTTHLGDADRAVELIGHFVRAFALSVPSGKKRSTAPHTPPGLVYLAARSDRPVSFAAAFENPVRGTGLLQSSVTRLADYAALVDGFFGDAGRLWHGHAATVATTGDSLGQRMPLPELIAQAQRAGAR